MTLIPLSGAGLSAGDLAAQGADAPGTQAALAGYQVPGESYTAGGLVVTPPALQPGYRPPQGQVLRAGVASIEQSAGAGFSALGTAANNAAQGAGSALNVLDKLLPLLLLVGAAVVVSSVLE